MSFNTAIARMMEFTNFFFKAKPRPKAAMEKLVLLLSPLAPHLAEELWQALGHADTLAYEPWPAFDEAAIARHERDTGEDQRQAKQRKSDPALDRRRNISIEWMTVRARIGSTVRSTDLLPLPNARHCHGGGNCHGKDLMEGMRGSL